MYRSRNQSTSGVTLIEVMIVLVVFSTMMVAVLITLNTSATMGKTETSQTEMQSRARNMMNDIARYLEEANLSAHEVDTRMRWMANSSSYEAYDKFHTWAYVKDDGDFHPALLQCPQTECGWSHPGGVALPRREKFVASYQYLEGPVHSTNFYDTSAGDTGGKGFSFSGRIYNDYFDSGRHAENGHNPYAAGYNHTTAQCIKGNGADLSPLVQLDVLQFPTPRNVKGEYITQEGSGRGEDDQGFLIYAPYYSAAKDALTMRRYAIFVTDFFEDFPWISDTNKDDNPLYDAAVKNTQSMDGDLVDIVDQLAALQTNAYIDDMTSYNQVQIGGATSPPTIPPGWSDDKPILKDIFDFNGNNLIETDLDADGNGAITYGTTRTETESVYEQFRLYPSTSRVDPGGRFEDWTGGKNSYRGLVYHKYSDQNLKGSYTEMEVYYFIDLSTGWTRFYFYCSWNAGANWYHINASYRRNEFSGMNPDFESQFYTPYQELGSGLIGLDFSTTETYPDTISSGINPNENAVRIGLLLDEKILQRGSYKFPSYRLETKVSLSP